MNQLIYKITILLFIINPLLSHVRADEKPAGIFLQGNVRNKTGEPLIGSTIQVQGTSIGSTTDLDGNFTITDIPSRTKITLLIKYIGYKPLIRELKNTSSDPLQIILEEDALGLDEIVVTGYTQTKKNARTSAITEVKSEDLKDVSGSSFGEKLQGQASGLLVSSTNGVPGSAMLVRLRGTTSINAGNEPLYIVDGVFVNNKTLQGIRSGGQTTNPLADLNPADIESVEVLKDANATAIYGARGANGVIIITTKRGASGNKTTVQFNSEFGFSHYDKLWDLTTGPEHALILNEAHINDGKSYESRPYRPVSEVINGVPGQGTPEEQGTYDRLGLLFRTGLQQTYNLSLSGGNEQTRFYVSGEYTDQESIIKLQDFQRYGFRLNLDHDLSKQLKFGFSTSYAETLREICRTGDTGGILNTGLHTPTLTPILNTDGTYNSAERFNNPYLLLENSNHHANGSHLIANTFLKWQLLNNLSFKTSWSIDNTTYHEFVYYNAKMNEGKSTNGSATDVNTTNKLWIAEQLINYYTSIGEKNFISLFLGNTLQRNVVERASITGTNFPGIEFTTISSAAVTTGSTSGKIPSGIISYFGGANYSYADKYSADFNFRADASSRFGKSNKWGYFPSGGVSWRIGQETFIKDNLPAVSELKVKASIGWTGNQEIADFASLGLWTGGSNYLDLPGISPYQLANSDLKWETTRQWNIGLESAFINNRLNIQLNYYNKYTTDLLLSVPVPAKTGFASTFDNLGEMSNKGFELEINSQNIRKTDFEWSTSINLSHNANKIEKLPVSFTQYNRDWVRLEEGYPMYSFWLYKQLYVDPQTGNAVYDDSRTKDGKITTDDRQIVGDAWPDFTGGLRNTFRYKNFDLSILFYFSVGNDVFNMNRYFQEHAGSRGVSWSLQKSMMDRWTKPGDITDIPRVTTLANADGSYNHNFESSRFLEDGSFIRLRNVSLGYTLPRFMVAKAGLQRVKLYANATNLLTFTGYSGADPEVNAAADFSNATVQGLDFSTPPHPRTFVIGINITY